MAYWLFKSEPTSWSWEMQKKKGDQGQEWDGVRNYQARNFLREMRKGDLAFFYHSSCAVPGVVGIVAIVREAYPDPTAFDPNDDHYDPKSDPAKPRWYAVDVKLEEKFDDVVPLETLRAHEQGALRDMVLLRKGNRLSVTPVTKSQWSFINALAKRKR